MPSEKMRYIRQRMKEKARTDIELTPLKAEIEAIFSERNIDEDCVRHHFKPAFTLLRSGS